MDYNRHITLLPHKIMSMFIQILKQTSLFRENNYIRPAYNPGFTG